MQRKRAGLTQRDLAAMLKVDKGTIWRIEKGDSWPTFDTLTRIAQVLKVETDVLLGVVDSPMATEPSIPISLLQRLSTANEDELSEIAMVFRVSDEVSRDSVTAELPEGKRKKR